jgi:hypothetical protein
MTRAIKTRRRASFAAEQLAKVALFFASFLFRQKKERRNAMYNNTKQKQCQKTVASPRHTQQINQKPHHLLAIV